MHDRDVALKKVIKTKKPEDIIIAKVLKNRYNVRSKQAKRDYIKNKLSENAKDPKRFWSIINDMLTTLTLFCKCGQKSGRQN